MKRFLQKTVLTTPRRIAFLCVAGAGLILPSTAQAKGTLADTIVEMSFSLDFALSGVQQNSITNIDDPLAFTVDRFESVTVSSMGDADVVPNANDQELLFSVSNTGNDDQAYSLSVANAPGNDFDVENLRLFYLIDDGDGIYDPALDGQNFDLYEKGRTNLESVVDGEIWVLVRGDMPTPTIIDGVAQAQIQLNASVLNTDEIRDGGTDKISPVISSRSSSGDIGSGTTGSDIGHFNMNAVEVDVTTTFSLHDDTSADCGDLTLLFNRGLAIPGACVEYNYVFNNSDETMAIENIAFSSVMNPNFNFMTAEVSGFPDGSLQLPASNADCAVTTCQVAFNDASLPPNSTASLRVRVKLK